MALSPVDAARDARKPLLLDAFCCGGGATRGYQEAGFYVVGVDIEPQPEYCGDNFFQADAIEFIRAHGRVFDLIHASPPCQDYIAITAGNRKRPGWTDSYANLVPPTRAALAAIRDVTGAPTVIECGVGQHLRRDLMLCGDMFRAPEYTGLRVQRHRYFEIAGATPPQPDHREHLGYVRGWRHGEYREGPYVAVYGRGGARPVSPRRRRRWASPGSPIPQLSMKRYRLRTPNTSGQFC